MTIQTRPKFYYIDRITTSNNLLNFVEPNISATELTATINIGSYSMTNLMQNVEDALNAEGDETYTVSFNRTTRLVTISSTDDFDLLVDTGSNVGVTVFTLLGFTLVDRTGSNSYTGDTAIGEQYIPQFLPQSFLSFDDNLEGIETSVNESASGVLEVITFGSRRFMEMNLKYITNRQMGKGSYIDNNSSAVSQAREFLEFLITKSELEFMINKDDVNTFDTVVLESSSNSKTGTGYELKELVRQGFNDYYETGLLKFRKVI